MGGLPDDVYIEINRNCDDYMGKITCGPIIKELVLNITNIQELLYVLIYDTNLVSSYYLNQLIMRARYSYLYLL